jgi:uncharacterized protein (TIGR02996 family)
MPRYELSDGSSNKFWEITLDGKSFKTTFGKIGSTGQTQLKQFSSDADAKKAYEKLIAEKTKKGYEAVGGGKAKKSKQPAAPAIAAKRNPELEKAIDNDPYDTTAYSVYADWLQDQGDPRGELIALQLAKKDKAAKALIAKHEDYFLGPLADHVKTYDGEDTDAFTWKFGFIHAVRLSHDHYSNEEWEGGLAKDVLGPLLDHPSGRFLAELTFVFNNDPNEDDLQDLIDVLAKKAPPTVRKLHFGDYDYAGPASDTATGNTEISWYSIGNLAKLWKAVPKLRTLITQCGSSESTISNVGMKLGTLELPELRRAEFRTGGLEKPNAKAIAAGQFPAIEHLEIWYGDDSYGGNASIKHVQPLLDRTDLPNLRYLGLKNALFTDTMIEPLAKSRLTKQLTTLDLSMGCLTDEGAQAIVKHKDAFAHLELLDVSENYLTDAGVRALKGVAKKVVAKEQRELDDPEYRYPAVGE